MITQEVIVFIKSQLASGKLKEDISKMLQDNGWKPEDVSEAFAQAMPAEPVSPQPIFKPVMQSMAQASPVMNSQVVASAPKSSKTLPVILAILLVVVIVVAGYMMWMLNAEKNAAVASLAVMQTQQQTAAVEQQNVITASQVAVVTPKDCGTSDGSLNYDKDPMLACLGAAALSCQPATGILKLPKGNITPGLIEISNTNGSCNVTLTEVAGAMNPKTKADISGQSITCPIASVVFSDKILDSANPTFRAPDTDNPGKYASEIYTYGSMGVFIQNKFDKAKIAQTGCTGSFIDTYLSMRK